MNKAIKALDGLVETWRNVPHCLNLGCDYDECRDECADELAALIPDLKAESECKWRKYDADDCGYDNCWSTACGEDFSIIEEWHEEPTKFCNNCGGKVIHE